MNTPPNQSPDTVQVIAACPFSRERQEQPVTITQLIFWYQRQFRHPVNSETVDAFLQSAHLFGATLYERHPQYGCYAIDGDPNYQLGEITVIQISYMGEIIYSH